MTNSNLAFDTIKDQYDLDTLREIMEHGCQSGVATNHIYYFDTVPFYDDNEEEIVEYVSDTLGDEVNETIWNANTCHINGYKNDTVWCFIELVASQLVDEYESTTQEELSDLDDNVYSNLVELSNTEWGRDHLEIVTS